MKPSTKRVLLIENHEDDSLTVRNLLAEISSRHFDVEHVKTVQSAREALSLRRFDICLVEHDLLGRSGLSLIEETMTGDPPFILLASREDFEVDMAATRAGAMGYLLKSHLTAPLLERSIRYAIQRAEHRATLEEALGQSRLLAAAVSNLTDGMVVTDARQHDNPIVFANPAFYAMTGYNHGEVLGRNCRFLQGEHTDPQMVQQIREALQARRLFKGVILNYRKDGTPFWNGLKITPVFDGEGELSHFVGIQSDITARLQSEIALRESEARKSAIFEAALDGILTIDHHNTIFELNTAAEKIFGIARAGAVGRNVEELFVSPVLHIGRQTEVVGRRADGTQFPAELAISRIQVEGEPLFTASVRDITERKQAAEQIAASELRYRRLFESAKDAILILDAGSGQIVDANPFLMELLGYEIGELRGKKLWDIGLFGDIAANEEAFFALQEAGYVRYENLPLETKGGKRIAVEFVSNVYQVNGSKVIQCNIRDITERQQAEESLHFQKALLETPTGSFLDGILAISDEAKILFCNQRLLQMWGIPQQAMSTGEDAVLLRAVRDQVADPVQFFERVEFLYQHRQERSHEEISLRDGRTFERYSAPITTVDGSYHGRVWYFRDISEGKRATKALQASETRFAGIAANVPGMVYQVLKRADGTVTWPFVSEGCRDIYEVEPQDIKNNPTLPVELVYPDDRADYLRTIAVAENTLLPRHWEGRLRLASGQIKWIQSASRPERLPDGGMLWNGLVMDITTRKEAEAERDRFFTMSIDMLGIAGLDGYFKRLNPAFSETLGFSEAELLAKPFLDFVHPEDRAATLAAVDRLSVGELVIGSENRYQSKDGSYRWLEWRSTADLDKGLIYEAARDVTQRKEAEAALLRANDALEARVDERTAELEQTNAALQFQIAEREGAEAETRARARQQEAVAELGQRALSNLDLPTLLQGALSLSAAVLDVDYGVLVAWFPDRGQAQIQATLGRPSHPLQTIVPVSPGSLTDYVLRSRVPVIMKDSRTETRFEISPLMREQGIRSLVAVTIQTGDPLSGALPYGALAVGSPREQVFSQDDVNFLQSISNILATAIDQRRIQQVAEQAREEAEAANLAKSEFLSRMSHELRTPLNAILGFGQILDRQELTPLQKESTGYILKGGRHLLTLINEVLDIARVEAGHMEISIEPIPLGDVLTECCALVRPLADQRGIRMVDNLADIKAHHAMADRQRLKQVIINLLSNAIKYNREGGEVILSVDPPSDGHLRLRVSDSGLGLSAQDLKKLFTPFERLGAADSPIEGTGLGLVLSQRLVTSMGGTLGVESVVEQGSTFWVELPRAESPLESLVESPPISVPASLHASTRPYTALSIEDNLSNIRLLEAILESRPEITLLTAMQGSIGLDLARQHHPDVILLDLHLPGLSGSEVLQRLRQSDDTRDIPVIVISADATPTQIERLLSAGAVAYFTKPLDINAFLIRLDEVLRPNETILNSAREKFEP